jgi:hypothetical protein
MSMTELETIGYNSSVQVGRRELHVQTEVIVREAIVIRTMVLEAGIVRSVERHTCPSELCDVDQVRAYASSQHERQIAVARHDPGEG